MTRVYLAFAFILGLAACGVDGEPIRPTVAGSVNINSSGVYPHVGVATNAGPVSVFVGL